MAVRIWQVRNLEELEPHLAARDALDQAFAASMATDLGLRRSVERHACFAELSMSGPADLAVEAIDRLSKNAVDVELVEAETEEEAAAVRDRHPWLSCVAVGMEEEEPVGPEGDPPGDDRSLRPFPLFRGFGG